MTGAEATTFISVRGEAHRTTQPDHARVTSSLRAAADSKSAALAAVAKTMIE